MITESGAAIVGQALANGLGGFVVIGAGGKVASANDTRLQFEVLRVPIRVRSYDHASNRVIVSATVPEDLELKIAEVGIVDSSSETPSGGIITTFSEELDSWNGGATTDQNVRVGDAGLRLASQTATSDPGLLVHFGGTKLSDMINVAYFGAGGDVRVKLVNTEEDSYSFTFTAQAGYNVHSVPLGNMVSTGAPDLTSVGHIEVTHSGSGSVTLDAMSITNTRSDEQLILRQRWTQLQHKVAGMPLDIDIPVAVTI